MTFVSYAQNGEDVMLHRALRDVERGFYIDVGAHDPIVDSVTRAFYERGWHGINIEPLAACCDRLLQNRPRDVTLQAAAGRAAGRIDFYEVADSGLSTTVPALARRHEREGRTVRRTRVACRTLDSICEDHKVGTVHFLNIDVEGAEADVLAGFALDRVRPWVIVVESTEPTLPTDTSEAWEPALLERGYAFAYRDGLNRFYLADEQQALLPRFELPPNVFDGYVRYSDLRLDRMAWNAEQSVIAAHKSLARIAELEARLDETANTVADVLPELAAVKAERDDLVRRLKRVHASAAWRIARVLWFPLGVLSAIADAIRAGFAFVGARLARLVPDRRPDRGAARARAAAAEAAAEELKNLPASARAIYDRLERATDGAPD